MDVLSREMDEISEEIRGTSQRLASLEHDARQPRLAMEVDGQADTETRERTAGAATAVQAIHGDSCSANRVDSGPKTTSTSFGVKTDPPALPCRDDVLVDKGSAVPKSCISPLETCTTLAAGGLPPTGETSTATKNTFDYLTLLFHQTEETHSEKTSTPSIWYDSSFRRNNLLAAPSCQGVIETKSGQNKMFDPGGSQGRLRACPFWGTWRTLLCGEDVCVETAGDDLQRFLEDQRFGIQKPSEVVRVK